MFDFSTVVTLIVVLIIAVSIALDVFRNPKCYPLPYRLRRLANWMCIACSYSALYIGRYNMVLLTTQKVQDEVEISDQSYGWIVTSGFWTYAVVSPFTGRLADVIGTKRCFVIGTIGSGVVNILLGVSLMFPVKNPVLLFCFFNAINFLFQSLSTVTASKINSPWYSEVEKGVFGGVFGAVMNSGYYFSLTIGKAILDSDSLPWYHLFILPGCILLFFSFVTVLFVKTSPTQFLSTLHTSHISTPIALMPMSGNSEIREGDVHHLEGNTNLEHDTNTTLTDNSDNYNNNNNSNNNENKKSNNEVSPQVSRLAWEQKSENSTQNHSDSHHSLFSFWSNIHWSSILELFAPLMRLDYLLLGLALFCIGWVREGLSSWFIPFLASRYNVGTDSFLYDVASAGVSLGGMIGGLSCGMLSDLVFKSRRPPALFVFLFLLTSFLVTLFAVTTTSPLSVASSIATSSSMGSVTQGEVADASHAKGVVAILTLCFVTSYGVANVLGVVVVVDVDVKIAAFVAGLITSFQYLASGFSGFLNGYLIQKYGYVAWTVGLIPLSGIAAILMGVSSFMESNMCARKKKVVQNSNAVSSVESAA